jgi:hypothetical protein
MKAFNGLAAIVAFPGTFEATGIDNVRTRKLALLGFHQLWKEFAAEGLIPGPEYRSPICAACVLGVSDPPQTLMEPFNAGWRLNVRR